MLAEKVIYGGGDPWEFGVGVVVDDDLGVRVEAGNDELETSSDRVVKVAV